MRTQWKVGSFLCAVLFSAFANANSDDLWVKIGESVDGETTHYIDTSSIQPSGSNTYFAWTRLEFSTPKKEGLFSKSYTSESRLIVVNCSNNTMATTLEIRFNKDKTIVEQTKWPESKWEFYSTGPVGSIAKATADIICSLGVLPSPRVNLNVFGDWTEIDGSSYLVDKSDTRFINEKYFTARIRTIFPTDKPYYGKAFRQQVEYVLGNCETGTLGSYAFGLFSPRGEKVDTKIYPITSVKMRVDYPELLVAMCAPEQPSTSNSQDKTASDTIERLANDKVNYPYFEQVRFTMADLLEQGKAQNLDDAYQQAVRIHQKSSNAPSKEPRSPNYSYGSGFFVSKSGDILTNEHVIRNCRKINIIRSDRSVHNAVKVATDASNDLALIKAQTKEATPLLPFRRAQSSVGEEVVAIGFPLPGILASDSIVTFGHINALTGIYQDTTRYQISASIQPGNSGGPLIDAYGNIAGVITEKLDAVEIAKQFNDLPQNINFAIKANVALVFLESYGVTPVIGSSNTTRDMPSATNRGRNITVQVVCSE